MLAIGSRGDVQPLVALGLGLHADGHNVLIATHSEFEDLVYESGLDFFLIQANSRELMASEVGQAAMESGSNPLRSFQQFARMVSVGIQRGGRSSLAACRGADLIIYSGVGSYLAMPIAESLKLPAVGAILQPLHRTHAFPSFTFPIQQNMGGFLNMLTYITADAMLWLPYLSAVNQFRKEQLNLPTIPRRVNYTTQWQNNNPVLYGFSPEVVPKPQDWGDHVIITGYWFLDRKTDWQPSSELLDFLADGSPPVYIGFGSMSSRKPKETTELVLKVLSQTGQRGLLSTGWGGLSEVDLPVNVFSIQNIPHDWLFPQMAAVVHHGGAGTTAAGLRVGVPSVIIPFFMDQYFWGQRVADLGVGPQPIPRKKLSVERLANAITKATTDKEMQIRAKEVGEIVKTEDGVTKAVEAVKNIYSAH
jgi:UDP:flavonoid glycosyltransferase YjiC (YdhE family)